MGLQGCLAALLLEGPSHGYQLRATLEAELGPLWSTRASQVYLTLGRMIRDGLVISRRVRQETRPDRQQLALTARGAVLAHRWLREPGELGEHVVRLAVARIVVPDEFAELALAIAEERSSALRQLRELRPRKLRGFQGEAIDSEIHRLKAELRWTTTIAEHASEVVARPRAPRVTVPAIRLA